MRVYLTFPSQVDLDLGGNLNLPWIFYSMVCGWKFYKKVEEQKYRVNKIKKEHSNLNFRRKMFGRRISVIGNC